MTALVKTNLGILLTLLLVVLFHQQPVDGQRSLLHWKRDLEFRLRSYLNQRDVINEIISSSIYPARSPPINGPARVTSGGNVRFSDLIIPSGSLVLSSHVARPTVRIMTNKTQTYVSSKMNELYQVRSQLDHIRRQMADPTQSYIYKGLPNTPLPQVNFSRILGTRVFKQFTFGNVIESKQVHLQAINHSSVDRVLNETYMENSQIGLLDAQSRLFFEGKKTFWRTVFARDLKSGCCDRMRPIHTNNMMIRSRNQDVRAPVMFHTNDLYTNQPVIIRQLMTDRLYNRILAVGMVSNRPGDTGLIPSQAFNPIQLASLIDIRRPDQPEILKTLVFREVLMVEEAQLSNSHIDSRLVIGVGSSPELLFDLSHDNHLLRFMPGRNGTLTQRLAGTLVLNGESHFVSKLDVASVNRVPDFGKFIRDSIVRLDQPAVIRGSVQFNALPAMLSTVGPSRGPHNVLIMHVNGALNVGLVNGMQLPTDLVFLPPHPLAPRADQPLRIRGPRQFGHHLVFKDHLQVQQHVNGMLMPDGVIPLHLNDFMGSVGRSNLWFLDGVIAQQVTVESGQFDNINLRDVYGDAASLLMRSVIAQQPDGSQLIRAPLRVVNLQLLNKSPGSGLLNGFRPEELMSFARRPHDVISGQKTFLKSVEVDDCVFGEINHLANWTNHLIRVDRPDTVQTVHTKLAFVDTPDIMGPYARLYPSLMEFDRLRVEFYPNDNPAQYVSNLNFSPELYIIHQALQSGVTGGVRGRIKVFGQLRLIGSPTRDAKINGIALSDIVTLDQPFRFADRFVMVGKVTVMDTLGAGRITSNYPIDAMDLVQFDKYRIPIIGSRLPIRLNNLVLSENNRASFVQCPMVNGILFNEFANSIMSLTRPQVVDSSLVFTSAVNLEGIVHTGSSLNGIKNFRNLAERLRNASYTFEDGLQCNSVVIRE